MKIFDRHIYLQMNHHLHDFANAAFISLFEKTAQKWDLKSKVLKCINIMIPVYNDENCENRCLY